MSDPVYVYIGTYPSGDVAKADLDVVRKFYADGIIRALDVAVVAKEPDGKVHVRRHEESTSHAAWGGAAVGALVGILFPPAFIATTVLGAASGGLVGHLWRGLSRDDLKDLGNSLDAGEASLVVIGTSEFDHEFTAALKAKEHDIKKLDKADARAFEHELKHASAS